MFHSVQQSYVSSLWVNTPEIEIERSFLYDPEIFRVVKKCMGELGIPIDKSNPYSSYYDTKAFEVLQSRTSLRHRNGGVSLQKEKFDPKYGVKYHDLDRQAESDKILRWQFGDDFTSEDSARIRREIECVGRDCKRGANLYGHLLPDRIKHVLPKRLGISRVRLERKLFIDHFETDALRKRYKIRFKPYELLDAYGKVIPFHKVKAFQAVHEDHTTGIADRQRGTMVAELVFDDTGFKYPRASSLNFVLPLGETEVLAKLSDAELSNREVSIGDSLLRRSLFLMDKEITNRRWIGHKRMEYTSSKAFHGYQRMPDSSSLAYLVM